MIDLSLPGCFPNSGGYEIDPRKTGRENDWIANNSATHRPTVLKSHQLVHRGSLEAYKWNPLPVKSKMETRHANWIFKSQILRRGLSLNVVRCLITWQRTADRPQTFSNLQNVSTRREIGVAEVKGGCRGVEFVGWYIIGIIIKAQNDDPTSGGPKLQYVAIANRYLC